MKIEIPEDNKKQNLPQNYAELMDEETVKRGQYYANRYVSRKAEINTHYEEWKELLDLYECERPQNNEDPNYPCNFMSLITPTIEGQVASMMESEIDFRHVSNNPLQKQFMPKFDALSSYYRKKTHFKQYFKDFARFYNLLGNSFVLISWETAFGNSKSSPSGYPRITIPPIDSVLVDGKIKDSKDLQFAEYIIIETKNMPISWARKEFGDKYANAISTGTMSEEGEYSVDDTDSFTYLEVWTRTNKDNNLQLIKMDTNGLIFSISDSSKPYYEHVNNEYPVGMARMIPNMGSLYGFGDGKILKKLQIYVNNLLDEIELAARFSSQSKIIVDPAGFMADGQLDSDPSKIAYCKDPNQNIRVLQAGGIDGIVMQSVQLSMSQAQEMVRFHDIMSGSSQGSSATATQINTQISQGHVGIKDKKTDISDVMAWADMYALKLCLEKLDRPFFVGMGGDASEYVDVQDFEKIQSVVPTTLETTMKIINDFNKNPNSGDIPTVPKYEEAMNEDGSAIYTDIDFETTCVIGESVPKDRISMFNMLLSLSQTVLLNADQTKSPVITPEKFKEILEEILGFHLETDSERSESKQNKRQVFDINSQNSLNPVGNNGTVQTPNVVPSNLQSTVVQQASGDSRGTVGV